MTDLFGLEQQIPKRSDSKEAAALVEVLKALRAHPAVSWCERQSSGAAHVNNHFIGDGRRFESVRLLSVWQTNGTA